MNVAGLDLAGNPENDSGFCILSVDGDVKHVSIRVLHSNQEIMKNLRKASPELTAVDAPLIYNGRNRRCDSELSGYGALPVTLRGMEVLALRGSSLAEDLSREGLRLIEVYATASAKILGLYNRNDRMVQKNLLSSGLTGDIEKRFLSRDELDAVFSAITAFLHLKNSTEEVGDEEGRIIIPHV